MTDKSGFTLVEIMIVVGVIGLLAAMAIPGVKKLQSTRDANTALSYARTLQNCLDMYKQEASDHSSYLSSSTADRYAMLVSGRWNSAPASLSALNAEIDPFRIGIGASLSDSIFIQYRIGSTNNFSAAVDILNVKKAKDLPGY